MTTWGNGTYSLALYPRLGDSETQALSWIGFWGRRTRSYAMGTMGIFRDSCWCQENCCQKKNTRLWTESTRRTRWMNCYSRSKTNILWSYGSHRLVWPCWMISPLEEMPGPFWNKGCAEAWEIRGEECEDYRETNQGIGYQVWFEMWKCSTSSLIVTTGSSLGGIGSKNGSPQKACWDCSFR